LQAAAVEVPCGLRWATIEWFEAAYCFGIAMSSHTSPPQPAFTNRLAAEKSPYLLQHAHNPVDWYPWGPEAWAKAQREDKPILLSIGYSTCHWCHVMERESFEDPAIAAFLNMHFVCIKVDREERPDLDRIYMSFVQALTGSGGWPLNVFLTPELKPFYGGTYWPAQARFGRPSFGQVLQAVHEAWRQRRSAITKSAAELHERLQGLLAPGAASGLVLSPAVLHQAARQLRQGYDPIHGGWGPAPKFPSPTLAAFLLSYGVRYGDAQAVQMVLHTCQRMAAGGIHDQLGGGFARYAVDAKWLVPHFEKMLYDNAQLLALYVDAYLVSGQQQLADVARGIAGYILRDMTHSEGGFYCAEDADSQGKEGRFYTWTLAELQQVLSPAELEVAARVFGVTESGNFIDHSDPEPLRGQNVLSVVQPPQTEAEAQLLASAKAKLLAARARRVRPHRDEKVLASWNGLMLGALAHAAAVMGEEAWLAAARQNLAFLQAHLWDGATRTLYHRWRDGARDSVQLLEAYADLLAGVLELYQVTLELAHLQFAIDLAQAMIERFYDPAAGGFWQSPTSSSDLILQVKPDTDGAEPSGNAVAIGALLKLAVITGRTEFKQVAEHSLRLFAGRMQTAPAAMPAMLLALAFWLDEPWRVVIAGPPDAPATTALVRAAHSLYQPQKVVLGNTGPVESFARSLTALENLPTAYLCTGSGCQAPTHDPAALRRLLQAHMPQQAR
jgi:uncharacterized protein YyaL (SSP411 family)